MREAQRRLSDENQHLKRTLEQLAQAQRADLEARQKASEPQLRDDDYADVRTVNKLAEQRAQAIVEQRMQQMNQVQRIQYAELALKQQFPDIERVVLDREIEERVRREEPEFYEAANLIQDPYKKGAALYKLMSKYKSDPALAEAKASAESNLNKVQPGPGTQRQTPLASSAFNQRKLSMAEARRNLELQLQNSGWAGK